MRDVKDVSRHDDSRGAGDRSRTSPTRGLFQQDRDTALACSGHMATTNVAARGGRTAQRSIADATPGAGVPAVEDHCRRAHILSGVRDQAGTTRLSRRIDISNSSCCL